MTKVIIDYICSNKDNKEFEFTINFKEYQDLKHCKVKMIEIISNIIGPIKYEFKYIKENDMYILKISKGVEEENCSNTKFAKNEHGIWDAPNCYECCSDCSTCDEECTCPLELGEEDCSNCIFVKGYKKCSECCEKPRTSNEEHNKTGYWHMCDDCISKIKK